MESLEIERKYVVDEECVLPAANVLLELGFVVSPRESVPMEATYFDTPEGALGAQRVAVRLRIGGKDEGWHLKRKGPEGSRERVWPPAAEMPAALRAEIVDRIGDAEAQRLIAIATMHTVREITRVSVPGGSWVIELADDRVTASNALTGTSSGWREWEAELAPSADPDLLDRLEPALLAAGATRVRGTSKLQRALGRPSDPVT